MRASVVGVLVLTQIPACELLPPIIASCGKKNSIAQSSAIDCVGSVHECLHVVCLAQLTALVEAHTRYQARTSERDTLKRVRDNLQRAISTVSSNQERLRKNLHALEKHGQSELASR